MPHTGNITGRYHGAITFFGDSDQALDRFTRITTATLEDYGHSVERQSILNQTQSRIMANHYLIHLHLKPVFGATTAQTDAASLQRLVIELCPVEPGRDDKDISELILVVMMFRMVDAYAARSVEWLASDTVLTMSQFLGAFSNVSPRRVLGRQEVLNAKCAVTDAPFYSIEETEERLAKRFDTYAGFGSDEGKFGMVELTDEEALSLAYRVCPHPNVIDMPSKEDQAASDIQRLATWGMTGMVGFLSAPVALSMVAVNLARGEDFRLNTNVLSLTGLLVMLQSTGALANAVSYLPL